ncbi:MAG TPA: adenine deaminase C-terminal domain-containing protein [Chloroflexota bacterium]
MTRRELVEAARGDRELDLVIRGGSILNVYTDEVYPADLGIYRDRIAVVDPGGRFGLAGREEIDAGGLTAIPGLIDTHVHIESTMVTPPSYARAVLPLGTTTVVIDPHEIGNVLGRAGVEYMLRASEGLPLRTYLTIPSCVPAVSGIETAGAVFTAADVAEMLTWPRVLGVAELMDYPGIVRQHEHMAAIAEAGLAAGQRLEGHAPLLSGRELNAYLAAGVDSDHESREWPEMVEKLRLGMWVYGRENTFRLGAADLARALEEVPDACNVAMCTDDIDPDDLLRNGHLDRGIRRLIERGVAPARAIRFATLNGATRYGLHDLGALAPGKLADVVLVRSLEAPRAALVLSGGRVVARDGALTAAIEDPAPPPLGDSVRIGPLEAESFLPSHAGAEGDVRVRVIAIDERRTTTLGEARVPFRGGRLAPPLPDDLALLSVVPRHGQGHGPSVALLRGLGLRRGAIATTVAHDSHNLIVAGKTHGEMLEAARAVVEMGGGAALVAGGEVLARVRLPVAGLMSDQPVEAVAAEVRAFNALGRELGLWATSPVLAISSLALPVSPHVRITDLGVVDVVSQRFVDLFAG